MRIVHLAVVAFLVLGIRIASAQQGFAQNRAPMPALVAPAATLAAPVAPRQEVTTLPTPANVTPEMWLYSQELDRHDDPAHAVRRKAEAKAAQRMQRIAAMKWYGMSNARPQASTTPMMGTYSPVWSGNGYLPYEWVDSAWPTTTAYIDNYYYDIRR